MIYNSKRIAVSEIVLALICGIGIIFTIVGYLFMFHRPPRVIIDTENILFTKEQIVVDWNDIAKVSFFAVRFADVLSLDMHASSMSEEQQKMKVDASDITITPKRLKSFMNDMIAVPQGEREEVMRRYFGRKVIAQTINR